MPKLRRHSWLSLDQNFVSLQPAKFHAISTLFRQWPLLVTPFDLALWLPVPLLLQEDMYCLFYITRRYLFSFEMQNNCKYEVWCDIVVKDVSHFLLWGSLGHMIGMLSMMAIEIHIPLKLESLNVPFCQLRMKELLNLSKSRAVIFLFFPIVI